MTPEKHKDRRCRAPWVARGARTALTLAFVAAASVAADFKPPSHHAEIEHIARDLAYRGGNTQGGVGLRADPELRDAVAQRGLVIREAIDDTKGGLQAMVLQNQSTGQTYVAFRGTWPTSADGVNDVVADLDIAGDTGSAQYDAHKARLAEWAQKYPGATVTGHSLGGALAQRYVSEHPNAVSEVVVFNAPAIGKQHGHRFAVETNREGNTKDAPPVTIYVGRSRPTEGTAAPAFDIVSEFGGQSHLPGRIVEVTHLDPTDGSATTLLNSHTASMLSGPGTRQIEEVDYDAYEERREDSWRDATPVLREARSAVQTIDALQGAVQSLPGGTALVNWAASQGQLGELAEATANIAHGFGRPSAGPAAPTGEMRDSARRDCAIAEAKARQALSLAQGQVTSSKLADMEFLVHQAEERATGCAGAKGRIARARGIHDAVAAVHGGDAGPKGGAPGAADATAILDSIRGQASAAASAASEALAACERVRAAASRVGTAWDQAASAVASLRDGVAAGRTPVNAGAAAGQAEAFARQAYAAGEVVSAARTRGIQAATSACQAADSLSAAALSARAQLRLQARQGGGEAGQAAAEAADALNRARAALASAQSLQASGLSSPEGRNGLRAAETNLRNALATATSAQASAEAELGQAEAGLVRAESLLSALGASLGQARGAGYDASILGALEGERTRAETAVRTAAACPATARSSLADLAGRGANVDAEAQTLLAAARTQEALPSAGADAQKIASAIADAQASFDAADLFADSARSAAANAEACRTRAEAVLDPVPSQPPAPAPLPPAGPPAGAGDWTAPGSPTTGGGQGQPSPTRPVSTSSDPRVPGLEASIEAAANGCQWTQAADVADQLAAIDPGNPWLAANRANIMELSMRQSQTGAALARGAAAVSGGDLKSAQAALAQAAAVAPACMSSRVTQLVSQASAAADAQRQASAESRRRGLGSLLRGLAAVQSVLKPRIPGGTTSIADLVTAAAGGSAGGVGGVVGALGGGAASSAGGCDALAPAFQAKLAEWQSLAARRPATDDGGNWCRQFVAWQRDLADLTRQMENTCVQDPSQRALLDQYYNLSRSLNAADCNRN